MLNAEPVSGRSGTSRPLISTGTSPASVMAISVSPGISTVWGGAEAIAFQRSMMDMNAARSDRPVPLSRNGKIFSLVSAALA